MVWIEHRTEGKESGRFWMKDSEVDGGVTRLTTGDLALRIFGHRAQKLQQIAEKIKEIYTSCQINHKSVMNE